MTTTSKRDIIHLIILVTLCLTAYSCALTDQHSQPTTAKEAHHGSRVYAVMPNGVSIEYPNLKAAVDGHTSTALGDSHGM